ncbi:MAG: alpha/beta-type small acid-soluble spore protein [Oscillospiraceae bacterium]|nr:alpha/beta-type small acid-soluble spore protein [Oscillospiraceae bacterium]
MANRIAVPEARGAMEQFKMETANELGVNFSGYNGDLTAKQCGSVGGEMVRKMVEAYQNKNAK